MLSVTTRAHPAGFNSRLAWRQVGLSVEDGPAMWDRRAQGL